MEKAVRDLNYSREGVPMVSKHVTNICSNILIVEKNVGHGRKTLTGEEEREVRGERGNEL